MKSLVRKWLLIYNSEHESIICIQEAIDGQSENSRDKEEVPERDRRQGKFKERERERECWGNRIEGINWISIRFTPYNRVPLIKLPSSHKYPHALSLDTLRNKRVEAT